jgi:hypothetical protein
MKAPLLEEWVRGVVFCLSSEICALFAICCIVWLSEICALFAICCIVWLSEICAIRPIRLSLSDRQDWSAYSDLFTKSAQSIAPFPSIIRTIRSIHSYR